MLTAAKEKKYTREYKSYRRTVDTGFVEAEKRSRQRYAEFGKWARLFAQRFPEQFIRFKREAQQGIR